jgi:hypothetical protein
MGPEIDQITEFEPILDVPAAAVSDKVLVHS